MNKINKIKIKFHSINEVNEFINVVNKYAFDMHIERGNLVVGATSILGIINLGVCKTLNLNIKESDFEELRDEIKPYIAA